VVFPCTPGTSIDKTNHHHIAEILLKVALNTWMRLRLVFNKEIRKYYQLEYLNIYVTEEENK
jgi:hypothetical protein